MRSFFITTKYFLKSFVKNLKPYTITIISMDIFQPYFNACKIIWRLKFFILHKLLFFKIQSIYLNLSSEKIIDYVFLI